VGRNQLPNATGRPSAGGRSRQAYRTFLAQHFSPFHRSNRRLPIPTTSTGRSWCLIPFGLCQTAACLLSEIRKIPRRLHREGEVPRHSIDFRTCRDVQLGSRTPCESTEHRRLRRRTACTHRFSLFSRRDCLSATLMPTRQAFAANPGRAVLIDTSNESYIDRNSDVKLVKTLLARAIERHCDCLGSVKIHATNDPPRMIDQWSHAVPCLCDHEVVGNASSTLRSSSRISSPR